MLPTLRTRRAASLKDEILAVARQLFARDGYAETSMASIAEASGVAIQTVYARVGSKPKVLLALLDVVDQGGGVTEMRERIAASHDALEVLALTAKMRRQLMESTGDIVRTLMASMASDTDVAAAWSEAMRRSRQGCERIAKRLQALGALRADVNVSTARDVLYTTLHPALYLRLVDECRWRPERVDRRPRRPGSPQQAGTRRRARGTGGAVRPWCLMAAGSPAGQ